MRKNKKAWESWEDEVAERLGGAKVKASGRFAMFKGDVKTGTLLVDCKRTKNSSYRLDNQTWDNLFEWGLNEGRIPALAIKCDGDGSEIAVMADADYCHIFGVDTSGHAVASKTSSKSISGKMLSGECGITLFVLGRRRLVAFPFDSLVNVGV